MRKIYFLFLLLFLTANSAFAQNAISFSPEVKRVAVFKNGYAFTYREGNANIQNGWVYTTNTPIGVLGTVWGYSTSPGIQVSQLLATESDKSEIERLASIGEVLLANEGKRIRFIDNYSKEYEGTYSLLGRNYLLKPDESGNNASPDNLTIVLNTETGIVFFQVNSLRNIEIVGQPKMDKTAISKEGRLMMNVSGANNGQNVNLGIAALERGIRWIPAYRVEVKGNPINEVKLELEANVINELTDLKDTEMNFVVGVPHFLFQDMMSPLSINTAFAGVSSYFQTGRGGQNSYSNAIMSQVSSTADSSYSTDGAPSPTVFGEEKLTAFSAEQLFLYKADKISLKKNERTSLRLFSLTVPAKEVFDWTITDPANVESNYYNYSPGSSGNKNLTEELSNKIWYALRLKNNTGMPWTTAPALSFREWKPLGQDMLSFTPIDGENILKVTPATEVIGDHKLEEKSRERVQLNYAGSNYNFDLITVEGTIKVRNIKKETIELILTRNLVGEVLNASEAGKISRQGLNLKSVNPNSTIKWNLMLPNGEKEIKYTYKIYVSR